MQKILELGRVLRPHGVRGVLKAENWCGDELFACWPDKVVINGRRYTTKNVAKHQNNLLLTLEEVTSADDAEKLRGAVITCGREDVELPEGRVLFSDLYGFSVYDERLEKSIGVLQTTEENAVQVILCVTGDNGTVYIPAVDPFLKKIDLKNGAVVVRTIEGMLPDED